MQYPWQSHATSDNADKIALRDDSQGVVFSWKALAEQVEQYAKVLRQYHIETGVGVALQGKNQFSLLGYYLAGLQIGARVLGLNPAFSEEKTTALCASNQIALLIRFEQNKPIFMPIKAEKVKVQCSGTMTLTSGSTGFPKAVLHQMQDHLDNAFGVCQLMQFGGKNSWLLSLPLYHVSGQGIVWRWLLQGAELHLPGEDFYVSALNATHISLVPTQAQRLLDYVQQNPQSAVKIQHILLGGSHIPTELSKKLTALSIRSYVGYGLTEMASTVFAKIAEGKEGVGTALSGRDYQIIDEQLLLRGAGLAQGYWQQGEVVSLLNSEGWFETKDRACWDGEQLYILGRLDNMFISGGENIQPEEIEQWILQYSQVEQAFVLPKADPEFGQRPVAVVKFYTGFSESAVKNLHIFLQDKLERFKLPVQYLELTQEMVAEQGQIKISRSQLKNRLTDYLGK